ncbi:MAG TPA: type III pantothenate kinase [Solirubrobacterales bacterium]|nr:type III pantothenate kinase [Solirubrobacterales bacterium]
MLLAIDVGNTSVHIGLYEGEEMAADWRLSSRTDRTADEVGSEIVQLLQLRGFQRKDVSAAVIGSVVPSLNPALVEAMNRYLAVDPLMVAPGTKTGVRILYQDVSQVGADRVCNALATFTKYGGPAVIIDFGTAVTYDAISEQGDYLGGAIAPGVEISLAALVAQTALLRRVEAVPPDTVIGRTTPGAIQSGLMWGFVSQVEGMVRRMVDELGGTAHVIATGGQAGLVAELTGGVIEAVDPFLTLEGLRLIHMQNTTR